MKPKRLRLRLDYLLYTLAILLCLGIVARKALYQSLDRAVRKGDIKQVRLLLRLGLSPNGGIKYTPSPLYQAIHAKRTDIALLLLRAGALGDLCEAVYYKNLVLAREMIKLGADVNCPCAGGSPLMLAVQTQDAQWVRFLLDQGADVHYIETENDKVPRATALTWAIIFGDAASVALFLARGADPNIRYDIGSRTSPLIDAAGSGYPGIVRLLLRYHAHVDDRTRLGATALYLAESGLASAQTPAKRKAFREVIHLLRKAGAKETSRDQVVDYPPPTDPKLFARWAQHALPIEHANDWPASPVVTRQPSSPHR